jgi:insulysin
MRSALFLTLVTLYTQAPCYQLIQDTTTVKIQTPSFESRKTAKIRLDNGLEAYIISDPYLKESGAALSVAVGSWDDPVDYPGMAHFLEHMLFMGTQAYPDEAEYSSFIQSHGGAMNAYTASDKTVYSFSINPSDFQGALDRFSHFFIDPLFSTNSLSRELHNVDQEHAKNVENDGSRVYMVYKQTSNPDHPNHAFSTGNADTLCGIPSDVMRQFYLNYYASDRMHLVIMDTAPLDTLIDSVQQKFSKVPESKTARQLPTAPLFSTAQKGALLSIRPLKQTKNLSLTWELDPLFVQDPLDKTAEFLSYLISSEAQGALAASLKAQGYIQNLTSSKDTFSRTQGLFSIDLDLTDLGAEHKDRVINICFNYLKYLQNTLNDNLIYDQWASIIKTRYQYQDRQDVFEQVTDFAGDLIDQPLASFPQEGLIPTHFDLAKFHQLLSSLTPSSCLYILLDQNGTHEKTEPWTGAQYALKPYSEESLNQFNLVDTSLKFAPLELNPYAPTTFNLLSNNDCSDFYEVLDKTQSLSLLYKPTNLYGIPEYCVKLKLTPITSMSKQDLSVFMSLFVQGFNKTMMYDLDAASYCGLRARLSGSEGAFWFTLEGFNDKALTLFTKIVTTIKSFQLSEQDFALIKKNTQEALSNTSKELSFKQGLLRVSALFDSTASLPVDLQLALRSWDTQKFNQTALELSSKFHIQGLILGHASLKEAQTIKDNLLTLTSIEQLPPIRELRALQLDEQKGPFIYKKNLSVQGSSLILAIQQDPLSPLSRAKTALLMPVLSEQFFDTLRTKQHTGYIAKVYDRQIAQSQFYLFGVQSNSHGGTELLYRFELFIEEFVNNFKDRYSLDQFTSIKDSLLQELRARKENLSTLAQHDMHIMSLYGGDFNWDDQLQTALQQISFEQLAEFAYSTLPRTNTKRVAFVMDGKLPEYRKLIYKPATLEEIRLQNHYSPPLYSQPLEEFDEYSKTDLQDNP